MYEMPNHAAPITPSDTLPLQGATAWISFVNSGVQTLTIVTVGGEQVTLTLPSGMYPIRASKVLNTGTTVTGIMGWWV